MGYDTASRGAQPSPGVAREDEPQADAAAKKVLIATNPASPAGGVVTMVRWIERFLRRRGYEVGIAYTPTWAPNGPVSTFLGKFFKHQGPAGDAHTYEGTPNYPVAAPWPELQWTRYLPGKNWRSLIDQFDYHLAVSGHALSALPFVDAGKPCLAWVATPYLDDKMGGPFRDYSWRRIAADALCVTPPSLYLERRSLRRAHTLAISQYTADKLSRMRGAAPVHRMPVPIDREVFFPAEPKPFGGKIGLLGRFDDPRKNIQLLIDAFALCRAQGLDYTLYLAGVAADPQLVAHIRRKGLDRHVRLEGFLHEPRQLRAFYQMIDIFAICSRQEGLCITGLEAMACGCPVVSTRCKGPEEYVVDGHNGYLADGTAAALAAALGRVGADAGSFRRMRQAAVETVARDYSAAAAERIFWRHFDQVYLRDRRPGAP